MEVDWRAVLVGFVVTLTLGIISGLIYVGSNQTIAVLYWGTVGVIGGLTAGYLVGGSLRSGAVHGGLATVLGSLIVVAAATLTSLLFAGLVPAFGVLIFGSLLLAFYAIPGALGGLVGSWAKERRSARETVAPHA